MSFKNEKDEEDKENRKNEKERKKEKKPFTLGFSIIMGPDGIKIKQHTPKGTKDLPLPPFPMLPLFPGTRPSKQTFKQPKRTQELPSILAPMDMQTDGENILLIYNIQSEKITVEASQNSLIIKTGEQVFTSFIPVPLDLNSLKASYRNGILEISGKIDKTKFKKIL